MKHIELVDRVYEEVKQMIFDQKLVPGQKIVQEKIAEDLGVSRSPLLKALQRLENEFLVESIPRRGMIVKQMSLKELIDIFECRAVLEGLSARLAAQTITIKQIASLKNCFKPFLNSSSINNLEYAKADRFFHDLIMKCSGNDVILRLELLTNVHLKAFQAGLFREPKETLPEHLAIIEALEQRNGVLAEKLMRNHIEISLTKYKAEHSTD